MLKWIANLVSKFHDDPTVNESEIVDLLERVWVYARKRKLRCKGNFSHLRHWLANSNGENVWKWVPNLILNFHDDLTVNESVIVIYWNKFGYMKKEKVLGEEEGKMNLRWRESVKTYRHMRTHLTSNISLFIFRILLAYFLLYFFYYFINKLFYFISNE